MTPANSTRASQRAASVRTALVLALVAWGFFAGMIVAQSFGSSLIGFVALGVAAMGFPLAMRVGKGRMQ